MAIAYFRWINSSSPDLQTALKQNKLTCHYTQATKNVQRESMSALWVFRLDMAYKPQTGISKGRTLVKITLSPQGETLMESLKNQIDFEDEAFTGEAGHPAQIIVKQNEVGARGIGHDILKTINAQVRSIEVAGEKEVKKALQG